MLSPYSVVLFVSYSPFEKLNMNCFGYFSLPFVFDNRIEMVSLWEFTYIKNHYHECVVEQEALYRYIAEKKFATECS